MKSSTSCRDAFCLTTSWAVSTEPQFPDLFDRQSEQEEVLCPHFLPDLHVGAVECTDGERAVQRELHVTGAAGLLARHGDLLGQIPAWIDVLSVLHAEIGEK